MMCTDIAKNNNNNNNSIDDNNNNKIIDTNDIVIDHTSKTTLPLYPTPIGRPTKTTTTTERMNTNNQPLVSTNTSTTALLPPTPIGRPTNTKIRAIAAKDSPHDHFSMSTSTNLSAVYYDNITPLEVIIQNWLVVVTLDEQIKKLPPSLIFRKDLEWLTFTGYDSYEDSKIDTYLQ